MSSEREWEDQLNESTYAPSRYKLEGFIHCSTKDQIERTANTIFKSHNKIYLLHIEEEKEQECLKCENLEGGEELFPHLYKILPKSSIHKSEEIFKLENGLFYIPFTHKL